MQHLEKCATGISGFDEITFGGLPKGRPTLIAGSAGSGKTMFGMEFIVNGVTRYDEPGIYVTFEERKCDLAQNFASVGFDLNGLVADGKLVIDHIPLSETDYQETGDFDLEGLFIRLNTHVKKTGAKRIVLDTIEVLFATFKDHAVIRTELQRLFGWFKDNDLTAVITGEAGSGTLTRYGLEEYVADCVIYLDNRVDDQIATRRLRIIKYRGSTHGLDEYPYLIDSDGVNVLPISSLGLAATAPTRRISTGIPRLDTMFSAGGYYCGSSVLISGEAGTGKTSMAATFAAAAVAREEKCLYFAFEESEAQIIRNMKSIGVDLTPGVKSGLLKFVCGRPTQYGLEMHLATMHKTIRDFEPDVIVVDPISNLIAVGTDRQVKAMLTRLIDYLKMNEITSLYTDLTDGNRVSESTRIGISSLMDSWLLVGYIEGNGERNRTLNILKSRGMSHSNQVREFVLSDDGIDLIDVYTSGEKVLTGAARLSQVSKEEGEALRRRNEREMNRQIYETKKKSVEAEIARLQADLLLANSRYASEMDEIAANSERIADAESAMRQHRGADSD